MWANSFFDGFVAKYLWQDMWFCYVILAEKNIIGMVNRMELLRCVYDGIGHCFEILVCGTPTLFCLLLEVTPCFVIHHE